MKETFCSSVNHEVNIRLSINSLPSSYSSILSDYLSINKKLIYGELRDVLVEYTKNNKYYKNDLNLLYQNIIHKRNICSLFTYSHYGNYVSMINIFDQHKNDTLKMFCIIFNAIADIFLKRNIIGIININHTTRRITCLWF